MDETGEKRRRGRPKMVSGKRDHAFHMRITEDDYQILDGLSKAHKMSKATVISMLINAAYEAEKANFTKKK